MKAATAPAAAPGTVERSADAQVHLSQSDPQAEHQAVDAQGQQAVQVESPREAERRIGLGQMQAQAQAKAGEATAEPLAVWSGEGFVGPTKEGEKPRVVVLGSGWAACRFMRDLDTKVRGGGRGRGRGRGSGEGVEREKGIQGWRFFILRACHCCYVLRFVMGPPCGTD